MPDISAYLPSTGTVIQILIFGGLMWAMHRFGFGCGMHGSHDHGKKDAPHAHDAEEPSGTKSSKTCCQDKHTPSSHASHK